MYKPKSHSYNRCFPHVINITVQAGLRQLTYIDRDVFPDDPGHFSFANEVPDVHANAQLTAHAEYLKALKDNVIAKARLLITACRRSGVRCQCFYELTVELALSKVQLLQNMNIRWSFMLSMLSHFLLLYQVCGSIYKSTRQV